MRRMVLGSLFAFILTTVAAIAANLRVDGKLISTASTGAPIEVASETLVEHLNADQVDGLHAEDLVTQDYLTESAAIHRELSFTADSTTFVVPAGVNRIEVTVIGGGGGGGGGVQEGGGSGGGGGGGAGLVIVTSLEVTPLQMLDLVVGVGGAGGAAWTPGTVSPGDDGANSVLSSPDGWRVEAAGGTGGSLEGGGSGSFGGGAGSVQNELPPGGFGTFGNGGDSSSGAGAGASGGSGGGAFGGGGGGGPGGGNGGIGSFDETPPSAGASGSQPGAGGGGGGGSLEAGGAEGGAGADGQIVIRWIGPPAD